MPWKNPGYESRGNNVVVVVGIGGLGNTSVKYIGYKKGYRTLVKQGIWNESFLAVSCSYLLSIKGYMNYHADIYKTMIKHFISKNDSLEDCLRILWKSRSMTHALCVSPISEAFTSILSEHCDSSDSTELWRSMLNPRSLAFGFQQNFVIHSTLSSFEPNNYDHAKPNVKEIASELKKDPLSKTSLFVAAYLYYQEAEIMTAMGLRVEALSYATEAYDLRTQLFEKAFMLVDIGDMKALCPSHEGARSVWSDDTNVFKECLTPWKIMECYLASSL